MPTLITSHQYSVYSVFVCVCVCVSQECERETDRQTDSQTDTFIKPESYTMGCYNRN